MSLQNITCSKSEKMSFINVLYFHNLKDYEMHLFGAASLKPFEKGHPPFPPLFNVNGVKLHSHLNVNSFSSLSHMHTSVFEVMSIYPRN